MVSGEYSAGMDKFPYWFIELKKLINLLNEDMTYNEIKQKNHEDNIFYAATEEEQ